jgi:hypothetical protein
MEKVSSGADQPALSLYFMTGMQIPEHEQGMRNKL